MPDATTELLAEIKSLRARVHELEESEKKYYRFYNHINEGVALHELIYDNNGKAIDSYLLEANEAFKRLTGHQQEQIIGKRISQIFPNTNTNASHWIEIYDQILQSVDPIDFQQHFPSLARWYQVSVYIQKPNRFWTVFQDMTQQQRIAKILQERESVLRKSQALARIGSYSLDHKTHRVQWSDELKRLLWWGKSEPSFDAFLLRIHPDDKEWVLAQASQRQASVDPYETEYRIVGPDGTVRWMLDRTQIEHDEQGRPVRTHGTSLDITERKEAEQKLLKSELQYRTLVNTAPYGIQLSDLQGRIVYSNPAHHRIHGYSDGELMGKYIWDLLADEQDRSALKVYYQILIKEQPTPTTNISKDRTRDGRLIDTQINWDYVRDVNGEIEGIISIISDITQQKHIQEQLRVSEERFKRAMNATNDGLYDWNVQTREVYFSPAWKNMLGYEDHELDNNLSVWENLTDPDALQTSWKILNDCIAGTRDGFEMEFKMRHKDGRWIDVLSRGTAYFDREGKATRIVGTHVDITKRKQSEEALKQSELNYRNQANFLDVVIESSPFAMWVSDDKGVMIKANQSLRSILNVSDEMLIGKYNVLHDENLDAQGFRSAIEAVFNELKSTRFTMFWTGTVVSDADISKANELWIDASMFPITNQTGKLTNVVCQYVDITEQKIAEKKLLQYQMRLKTLTSELTLAEERLKNMLATRLHDNVCQQLAMLRVDIAVLEKSLTDPGQQDRLKTMYKEVGNILDETRYLTSELSCPILNLHGLEEAIRTWSDQEISKKHDIEVRVEDDGQAKPLSEDVKHVLFRSVREFLINVVKHANASRVNVQITREDNQIVIIVKDNGIGLRTDADTRELGSGFGILSISEALQGLGGNLTYQSKPTQGCTAKVVAPLAH